ncbi:MAG TPA: YggS family pyridoxal phosphate-dependent enzyme [Chthoniobacteraceae bacterium]|nr:YggS family pyridoxal phosphate-dependent enzyme [Chthoniobacteraceae bacterium]
MSRISPQLDSVKQIIAETALAAGRQPDEVSLVAVTKTHPPETIREAIDAGQLLFGENRVQEARAKIPLLPAKARWHLIGHLQKNKIRAALPLFELIHGVDALALARDIDRVAGELGLFPKILLEVNVAGEATKFGFKPEQIRADIEALLALERLQIEGLMTIAPIVEKPDDARKYFATLRELRDALQSEYRIRLPELSMGMSGDYTAAIREGATMVRVGTAIFGPRSGKNLRASDALSGD